MGNFSNKNVNVTTLMFLMSGDLTGLCLYIHLTWINLQPFRGPDEGQHDTQDCRLPKKLKSRMMLISNVYNFFCFINLFSNYLIEGYSLDRIKRPYEYDQTMTTTNLIYLIWPKLKQTNLMKRQTKISFILVKNFWSSWFGQGND